MNGVVAPHWSVRTIRRIPLNAENSYQPNVFGVCALAIRTCADGLVLAYQSLQAAPQHKVRKSAGTPGVHQRKFSGSRRTLVTRALHTQALFRRKINEIDRLGRVDRRMLHLSLCAAFSKRIFSLGVVGPVYEYLFRHICCNSSLSAGYKGFLVLSMFKIYLKASKSFCFLTVRKGCLSKNGTMILVRSLRFRTVYCIVLSLCAPFKGYTLPQLNQSFIASHNGRSRLF